MTEDKIIKCTDCSKEFTFTIEEYELYQQLVADGKFTGQFREPKRCKDCRAKRKALRIQKETQEASPFKPILDQIKHKKY